METLLVLELTEGGELLGAVVAHVYPVGTACEFGTEEAAPGHAEGEEVLEFRTLAGEVVRGCEGCVEERFEVLG